MPYVSLNVTFGALIAHRYSFEASAMYSAEASASYKSRTVLYTCISNWNDRRDGFKSMQCKPSCICRKFIASPSFLVFFLSLLAHAVLPFCFLLFTYSLPSVRISFKWVGFRTEQVLTISYTLTLQISLNKRNK